MGDGEQGRRVWFFPDGDIPRPGEGELKGHESLIILNPGAADAEILLTVYYEDREPEQPPAQAVKARRVRCIRLDQPIDGYQIPFGQYALKLESSAPVICQIGRMDISQPNLAYYTVMGFPC
jgi:hypothetical protein